MKFLILMYHIIAESFNDKEKLLTCSPTMFRRQMKFLHDKGYNVIKLEEAINAIQYRIALPNKSIVITFDDGFIDTYETAFPILLEFEFPATIFVVSDLIGATNKWMSGSKKCSRRLCNWSQLKEMNKNGIIIGSHTRNHVKLNQVSQETAKREIFDSKKEIEDQMGAPVDFFAYPYGCFSDENKKMVAVAGYHCACSTMSGFNNTIDIKTDLYRLRRIDVYGTDSLNHFKNKIVFGTNKASRMILTKYYCSQLLKRFRQK